MIGQFLGLISAIIHCSPSSIFSADLFGGRLLPFLRRTLPVSKIVYYATRFINGTLDTSSMLGTSEA
jgi:hypothetical protein